MALEINRQSGNERELIETIESKQLSNLLIVVEDKKYLEVLKTTDKFHIIDFSPSQNGNFLFKIKINFLILIQIYLNPWQFFKMLNKIPIY